MWPWKKAKRELVIIETPVCEFTRWSDEPTAAWEGRIMVGMAEITLLADDVEGKPDPQLLAQIPIILTEHAILENAARHSIPALAEHLTAQHHWNMIISSDGVDFSLGFFYEDGSREETVFVDFKDKSIVEWSVVD